MEIRKGTRILLLQETNILLPVEKALRTQRVKIQASLLGVSDGIQRIHEGQADIALVDLYISGGGGMYLLSMLKHIRPGFPAVVFYPSSDRLHPEIISDLGTLGAAGVVPAPYDVEQTIAQIAILVNAIPEANGVRG